MLFGKHINRYYLRHLPVLFIGLIMLILVDYVQLIIPNLYKLVVDGLNYGEVVMNDGEILSFDMDFLLDKICLPMIFIIVCMVIGRFIWRVCFYGSGIKVETDLRKRMFDHCKDLSQEYYQVNKVGNMMSLFINDLETVQDCFSSGILMFCDALFLGILAVMKMGNMDTLLTLLCFIPMVLLSVGSMVLGKYMTAKWEKRQAAFASLSDFSQESFAGIAVIKAFVKEGKELFAFKKLNKENEKINIEYTKLSTTFRICVQILVQSVICIILGYGGYLVYLGKFTGGELVEFIGYFTSIIWPIMAISELIEMHSRGKASLNRISELLEAKINVQDSENVSDPGKIKGDIEFRNLTFRYPDGEYDVLKNVSFKINAGENVGIIGRTGSGKTTIVDLILRTYNVSDNTLFVDGKCVNTIPIRTLRKYAAYVPQDNFLFSDTIENNISFATDGGNFEDVVNSAKLSDVHSNIEEFADKYKTVLGERGVTVSGGQKQRISIARAMMKKAPILILDDSVSAVDVKTEKAILENLRETRKGKTTILIAHRISTIEKMDKIIFIEEGEVKAIGTHEELCKNCEEYSTMVQLQKLDDIESSHDSNDKEDI